jgi:hypothetical protein
MLRGSGQQVTNHDQTVQIRQPDGPDLGNWTNLSNAGPGSNAHRLPAGAGPHWSNAEKIKLFDSDTGQTPVCPGGCREAETGETSCTEFHSDRGFRLCWRTTLRTLRLRGVGEGVAAGCEFHVTRSGSDHVGREWPCPRGGQPGVRRPCRSASRTAWRAWTRWPWRSSFSGHKRTFFGHTLLLPLEKHTKASVLFEPVTGCQAAASPPVGGRRSDAGRE